MYLQLLTLKAILDKILYISFYWAIDSTELPSKRRTNCVCSRRDCSFRSK